MSYHTSPLTPQPDQTKPTYVHYQVKAIHAEIFLRPDQTISGKKINQTRPTDLFVYGLLPGLIGTKNTEQSIIFDGHISQCVFYFTCAFAISFNIPMLDAGANTNWRRRKKRKKRRSRRIEPALPPYWLLHNVHTCCSCVGQGVVARLRLMLRLR